MRTVALEAKGEEIMTDFQFKTVIKMVLNILKSSKDIQEAIKGLEELLDTDNK